MNQQEPPKATKQHEITMNISFESSKPFSDTTLECIYQLNTNTMSQGWARAIYYEHRTEYIQKYHDVTNEMSKMYMVLLDCESTPHDAEMIQYVKNNEINLAHRYFGPIHVKLTKEQTNTLDVSGYYFEGHIGLFDHRYVIQNDPVYDEQMSWTVFQLCVALKGVPILHYPYDLDPDCDDNYVGHLLMKYGADPKIRDASGQDSFDIIEIMHGVQERDRFWNSWIKWKYPLSLSKKESNIQFRFENP